MIRILSLGLLVFAAACGSRSVGTAPAPDDGPSVRVWREELEDNSNSTVIWAENTGKVPVEFPALRHHGLLACLVGFQHYLAAIARGLSVPGRKAAIAPARDAGRPRDGSGALAVTICGIKESRLR